MKILILGGAGDMAVSMVELMKKEDDLERVTLADLDEAKAQSRAREAGAKFFGMKLDATQHKSLVEAMKEHDLALSYVGPFYHFERPVAQAAIDAGVHYISIADDYDAFLKVADLEEEARKAEVKVLTGFGNSPGLTQILARKGYMAMDSPKRIAVNWAAGSNEAVGPANLLHVFHLMSGKTLQWRNGREEYVPCGGGRKIVQFPEPIGRIPTWYTGHAESVSIPRNLEGLDYVSVHGGVVPPFDFQLIAVLGRLGLTTTHERRKRLFRIIKPILPLFQSKKSPDKSVGRVEVWGTDQGKETYVYYTYVGHIAFITSCPCLQAILWLQKGKFDHLPGGVYSSERLIEEADPFLRELESRGMEIKYYE
ncbi:MAG: saccharopine dehydrogenase NADP-binding domain-containing protein [Candidatus Hydrogenedentota bacterium]|nr:MAG: saccharopine dehydrogenase NADP-binding domain-containing protein [Candidatus Hydrogenedentota bacterium]